MPQLYMLDTDISSYAMRNYSQALWLRHISPASICISTVSAAEILEGIKPYPLTHPLHPAAEFFLNRINTHAWDLAAAKAYADVRYSLRRSGNLIGELDRMIAAHALSLDAVLVTNNTRHFERISPPLRLENWV